MNTTMSVLTREKRDAVDYPVPSYLRLVTPDATTCVKIEVAEDHTRKGGGIIFKCLPIGQQYMNGLKDIMIEEEDDDG